MKLTIGRRIYLGFFVALFLMLVVAGLGVERIQHISGLSSSIAGLFEEKSFVIQKELDHFRWVSVLSRDVIMEQPVSVQMDPTKCSFGKWLYSSLDKKNYPSAIHQELVKVEPIHRDLHASAQGIDRHMRNQDPQAAEKLFLSDTLPILARVKDSLQKIGSLFQEHLTTSKQSMLGTMSFTQKSILVVSALALIIGAVLAFLIAQSTTGALHRVVQDLGRAVSRVNASSNDLARSSDSLAHMVAGQAASLEETSASLTEIASIVEKNIENTDASLKTSAEVGERSRESQSAMDSLSNSMSAILNSNQEIEQLVKVIQNIGEKTQVMDEIVFQTKLLSFNASVEAERAGEHGKGFAVVAQEIGNLAKMSGESARQISEMVDSSVREAESIVSENNKNVSEGNRYVSLTAETLNNISVSTGELQQKAELVASASVEQNTGLQQVNIAVQQLDRTTQDTAATAEGTSRASEELEQVVHSLDSTLERLNHLIDGGKSKTQVSQAPPQLDT